MSGSNFSFNEVKSKLERFCAYQDRCVAEVMTKIQSFQLKPNEVETLLYFLKEEKYLDENRFAESYVSGKLKIKCWGRIKIKQALKLKQVSAEIISSAISQIDGEEYSAIIQKLVERKNKELFAEKDRWKRNAKIMRYLQSKGFESDLILDQIKLL